MLATLNDVLIPAQKNRYAVGLFNTVNLEMARGVLAAAEENASPVIIGTAEVLLPFGPMEELSYLLVAMAKKAKVPVVLHYDHGLTFEKCIQALKFGFSSIMYDCSTDSYEENIRRVKELAYIAHQFGATIEGELGHVGDSEDSAEGNSVLEDPTAFYTDPEQAADYVARTGIDALAVAVGTVHGAYKFTPSLDYERIEAIRRAVSVPLVLHGGSGLPAADFKRAIDCGVCKVNIFTDVNTAAATATADGYAEGKKQMTELIPGQVDAVKKVTTEKMELFGCVNRANL